MFKKKSLDPHALSGIPCQIFKLELIPIFCQIIEDKRTFSNSFYEVSVILILKPDKDSAKKREVRLIDILNIVLKILHQRITSRSPEYEREIIDRIEESYPAMKDLKCNQCRLPH